MPNNRMDKQAATRKTVASAGTADVNSLGNQAMRSGAGIVRTQNLNKETPVIKQMGKITDLSMNVPGNGQVARAPGPVREGSAQAYANAMEAKFGSIEAQRGISNGD